jgi:beta-galactosidase
MMPKPFWALEFAIGGGHGLWAKEGRLQPLPGAIELEVMHAFASGAELLTHFQYKQFRSGAEQLNYALLDTDRVPRRRFFDFQATAKALERYSSVLETTTVKKPSTAIIFDYNALWALLIKPVNHDFSYIEFVAKFYDTLKSIGVEADIVSPKADISGYTLVIAPSPIVTDKAYTANLESYVKNGGCLLGTFLTSVKDYDNVGYDVSLPANLTEVFGITVSEVEPVFEASRANVELCFGNSLNYHWLDELECTTAEAIGTFFDTYRKGNAVITKNRYGKGTAYYMGTMIDDSAFKTLLDHITNECRTEKVPFKFPECCTVVTRVSDDKTYYFIFNYGKESVSIDLENEYTLFDGEKTDCILIPSLSYICIA